MALRKPRPGEFCGPTDPVFSDNAFSGDYPTLHEYLFCARWPDGTPRATSTLSIFTDNGSMKLVVNDRDNNRSAFFSAETFRDLLDKVEAALSCESADWRIKGSQGARNMQTPF